MKLVVVYLMVLSGISGIQGQTVIPYLQMKNHLEGSPISDLTNFSVPDRDFTLEVTVAGAGQAVSVAKDYLTYTSTSLGKVRFAKQGQVVHIYENGIYKTTVKPGELSVTYSGSNLLKNPGFEDVVANPEDGSNFKDGIYWNVYNSSQTESWKSGGSIRTTRYEGAYSLLMRNEGVYLTQSVSQLKPNTYYKISYYHRPSTTSQGGASYQIELGSSQFATDGGKYPAHTTSTGSTNWVKFETVVKTGAITPSWFALHRLNTGNKYDYLDGFSILEGTETSVGISGVTEAICVEGVAYSPEITLGQNEVFDMTSLIINPDFELDPSSSNASDFVPTGWQKNYNTITSKISTAAKGDGLIKGSPNLHYQIYHSSGILGKLTQIISGLPEGRYTVQSIIVSGNSSKNAVHLYANGGRTPFISNNTYTVDGIVTGNGNLEIGLDIATTDPATIDIDHFRLYYWGAKYSEPTITVETECLPFDTNNRIKTFRIKGYALNSDITLSVPAGSGITLSQYSIPALNSQNVDVEITATFDPEGLDPYHINTGIITISNDDVPDKRIPFSADPLSDVIPYLPMKNDFGGQNVVDLDSFTPFVGDFTLELSGVTSGVPVSIGNGYLIYTPTASGTIRLVQKGDLVSNIVFVYENGVYKTTLKPTPIVFSQENLLKNPGFETNTASGTHFKDGINWNVYNAEYSSTWGTEGSIRTARKTDGSYSLLMRDPAAYLTQKVEGLKPDTYYKISYYFSSNEAKQGGASYQIRLGSNEFGTDGGVYAGHTTSTENIEWSKFETIVKTNSAASKWFTLHRLDAGGYYDWYDGFSMLEGTFSIGVGITNAGAATYLEGEAYAPESEIASDKKYDMTYHFVINPEFEKDLDTSNATTFTPYGWAKDFLPATSKISTAAQGNGTTIITGQNHWQVYSNRGLSGKMYQIVTDLPSGKYILRAGVHAEFEGSISLYAGDSKKQLVNDISDYYETETTVYDGTLEIGLELASSSLITAVALDHVSLIYIGDDIEDYKKILTEKLAIATTNTSNPDNPGYYNQQQLRDAIDNGNAALTTSQNLLAAIKDLTEAIKIYDEIMIAYNPLKEAIDIANNLIEETEFPCKSAFQSAVDAARNIYDNPTDQKDKLTSAVKDIKVATSSYYDCAPLPEPQVISYVDTSLSGSQKYVLRVDEKAFFPTNIQVRMDKLRYNYAWNAKARESVFKLLTDNYFNTMSLVLHWIEVEPEKDVFDWSILDEYLTYAKKHDIKLEILWFGANNGGQVHPLGDGRYRVPEYVFRSTPEGTASDYTIDRGKSERTMDLNDINLRNREAFVLEKVMNHIAVWDKANGSPHAVVGIQINNEVKGYGTHFPESVVIDYMGYLGGIVKKSPYKVWTRMNCIMNTDKDRIPVNENLRKATGTHIDFIGVDIYRQGPVFVRERLPYLGKNYRNIMEFNASVDNAYIFPLAAISANAALNYYALNTDGYELFMRLNEPGQMTQRGDYVDDVRNVNRLILGTMEDIALYSQGYGLFVHNKDGNSTVATTGVDGITFTPASSTSQGVSIHRSNTEIVLLNTKGGVFNYPESLGVTSASVGHFDNVNKWVEQGIVPFSSTSVNPPRASIVRLICKDTGEKQPQYIYQAEFAEYAGGTTVSQYPKYEGFSGNGAVLFPSSGGYVQWSNIEGQPSCILGIRYALSGSASLSGQLTLNGITQEQVITFEPTGANDIYRTVKVPVVLENSDANIIKIESLTGLEGVYIDELQVYFDTTTPLSSTWTPQSGSTDWADATNWSDGVPGTITEVTIPQSESYPILTEATEVQTIYFEAGSELGRQDLLTYQKAFVNYDFGKGDRSIHFRTLALPLQEAYPGDFTFGGQPDTYIQTLSVDENGRGKWTALSGGTASVFTAGTGFALSLDPNKDPFKGLALSQGILRLPFFDSDANVDAQVHPNHTYNNWISTFTNPYGAGSYNVTRSTKAYKLAGAEVSVNPRFGQSGSTIIALVGNPFITTIDFSALHTDNASLIKNNYQIWTKSGSQEGYAGYSPNGNWGLVTTPGMDQLISPLQGFIVERNGEATGTLDFNLLNIASNQSGVLKSAVSTGDKLNIIVKNETASVQTFIAKREGGSVEFGNRDARKLINNLTEVPDIYTLKPSDKGMVAVGANIVDSYDIEYPLGIASSYSGEITFTFSGMDSYATKIFFTDKELKKTVELTGLNTYEYTFNYQPVTTGGIATAIEDRFSLRLASATSGIEEELTGNQSLTVYVQSGYIHVGSNDTEIKEMKVYNLNGSIIYYKSGINSVSYATTRSFSSGVYIVEVKTDKGVERKKIIITNI